MKKIIAGILALFISFAATAQEGPRAYATLGGALMTFDDGFDSVEPINVFGRLGYDFNENIGIGVEGSFSLIEDDVAGVDFSVTTVFFYLKGSIPVGDGAKLYAMIGSSNVDLSGSFGGFSTSADDSDTGYGFGYEQALGSYSISVDYIIYNNNSTFAGFLSDEVTAINVGFVTYF